MQTTCPASALLLPVAQGPGCGEAALCSGLRSGRGPAWMEGQQMEREGGRAAQWVWGCTRRRGWKGGSGQGRSTVVGGGRGGSGGERLCPQVPGHGIRLLPKRLAPHPLSRRLRPARRPPGAKFRREVLSCPFPVVLAASRPPPGLAVEPGGPVPSPRGPWTLPARRRPPGLSTPSPVHAAALHGHTGPTGTSVLAKLAVRRGLAPPSPQRQPQGRGRSGAWRGEPPTHTARPPPRTRQLLRR